MPVYFWLYAVCFLLLAALYYLLPHRYRWPLLLAAGYGLYALGDILWLLPLLFVTLAAYAAGLLLEKTAAGAKQKALLAAAALCLLLPFALLNYILPLFAGKSHALLLPLGIGFYTLRALGYVIDVYRGDAKAERHLGIFALFISFFPALPLGPVERAADLLPQLRQPHRFSLSACSDGLRLILWGLVKKAVIAAYLAPYVDRVFGNVQAFGGLTLIGSAVLLCLCLYCDFSGWIDIAAGCAALLGFRLAENFRSPFYSSSLLDFWQRWHITLTAWFRDYVYVPLRSLRAGRAWGAFSLFAACLLYALWHGASPTILLWGAGQGTLLLLEQLCAPVTEKHLAAGPRWRRILLAVGRRALVLSAVAAGFVALRAESLADLLYIAGNFLRGINPLRFFEYMQSIDLSPQSLLSIACAAAAVLLWDGAGRKNGDSLAHFKALPTPVRWALYYAAGFLLLLFFFTRLGHTAPFFRFPF